MSPPKRSPKGRPTPPAAAKATAAGATRWTRWIAYAMIAAYGVYWLVTSFSHHTIGNYAVETDFYWKYGPAARDLLHGLIKIENYDSKGWGYPLAVAAFSLLGFDLFRSGQIVSLLSAVGAAWVVYRLHRSLFGPTHALASLAIVLTNLVFLQNTYEVGTDMFFLAISMASVGLLLRSQAPSLRATILSGLIGGFAFSTRYNALFLLPGALLLFLALGVPGGPMRDRARRAALWTGMFVVGALPWLIVNAIHTGNPLTNSNYVNVGFVVYGEGNWEKYFYGERTIHTLGDIIFRDPGRFIGAMGWSLGVHLRRDLSDLLPLILGVFVVLGAILLWRDRCERRVTGYMIFGGFCFLTLIPIFYGARLSLPVLPFYAALAAVPLVSATLGKPLASAERVFPLRSFLFLLLLIPIAAGSYGQVFNREWSEWIGAGPKDLGPAIQFLKTAPREPDEGLMARKPHAAFLAGLPFLPMPAIDNLDSLHVDAVRNHARYVLISNAEVKWRPAIQPLVDRTAPVPGFHQVHESYGAIVYEVVPTAPRTASP